MATTIETETGNKRIAKNTVFLYIRMVITTLVGFYTGRVVLETLGVEDYGLQGIVGSATGMLGFLNTSMSSATSRFITFEIGKKDNLERAQKTFIMTMNVHLILAIIFVVFAETVGLWFLYNKLVIPPERMDAALWIFHMSVLGIPLGLSQIPYSACIVAHERMNIYAYFTFLDVFIKLAILYIVQACHFDRLIFYATLMFAVSIIMRMVYRIYCIRNFEEAHYKWCWDSEILKPMLKFSGWDLYGNMCVSLRQQGNGFLINMFHGLVYNAASGVAVTIQGIIVGFAFNIIQAFRPAIIKSYAAGDIDRMQTLLESSFKFMILMFGLLMTPFVVGSGVIMKFWLGNPPLMADVFCKLLIIYGLFQLINNIMGNAIHATGDVRRISFISGTIFLASLGVIYVAFRFFHAPVWHSYYIIIATTMIVSTNNLFIVHKQIPQLNIKRIAWSIIQPICIILIASIIPYFGYKMMGDNLLSLAVTFIDNILITGTLAYLSLDRDQKQLARSKAAYFARKLYK